jgi:hydrogenase maturation protein HypF
MVDSERWRLKVSGVVQGVGFRPFVYSLATRYGLAGSVGNNSSGVLIEIEGPPPALETFRNQLQAEQPPLARIESVETETAPVTRIPGFSIHLSNTIVGESTPISPDIAICAACLKELFDPADRRYRYPFINCTNCGPRFTIIRDIPYDRPFTTMAAFKMCPACDAEYHDPLNRRFHAQPNACAVCGPSLAFHPGGQKAEQALAAAKAALAAGKIVAVKGIGGFHLACDATNATALAELRRRKGRVDKPFALMARDLAHIDQYACMNDEEASLLLAKERPIVLLRRKSAGTPSPLIAPGNNQLGFFLPYSPLHHLLVEDKPLVMTSGNRSDEPIVRDNEEALHRLADLADAFLLHDRDIHVVCDDSVVRIFEGRELPLRRSRGYAPLPVRLANSGPSVLATGGELKATLCLTKDSHAYMSQHIGDMENIETLEAFDRAFQHLSAIFRLAPERVACDLHPGYLSTHWAEAFSEKCSLPLVRVQHHHAHIASLLAEHTLSSEQKVIGVSFDGTGYGTDGAIWGGELLLADCRSFSRLGHLKYVPLPGGDAAVKRPYRMALAHLRSAGIPWTDDLPCVRATPTDEKKVLDRQLEMRINCVDTSSMGRLFDAAASLLDVRHTVTYEAQGAMELEAISDVQETTDIQNAYRFEITGDDELIFDPAPLWHAMVDDLRHGTARTMISARFHRAVANLITELCVIARERFGLTQVALSGGVFQNSLLLELAKGALTQQGFEILTHRIVPPNDGGLALGQAAIARESEV